MRIAVLSRLAALYSTSRLVRVGRARGHDVDVICPLDLQVPVGGLTTTGKSTGKPLRGVCYAGRPLRRYQAIIPRIGTSISRYGVAVVRTFERSSAVIVNRSDAITLARDRLRSLALLDQRRIAVPRTIALNAAVGLKEAARAIGGFPAVVKLHQGTQGVGTMLVESFAALSALAETMWAMGHEILLQEFVKQAKGRDIRAFVVGNRVIASMERRAQPNDFRANLHRGAKARAVDLTSQHARIAVKAARVMGLEVAGVDLLQGRSGPLVLEVNASPGLEGIEEATAIDVATPIIQWTEHLDRRRLKRRQK